MISFSILSKRFFLKRKGLFGARAMSINMVFCKDYYFVNLSFWLLTLSAIISSKTINTIHFLPGFYSTLFLDTSCILFEYFFFNTLDCLIPIFSRFSIMY